MHNSQVKPYQIVYHYANETPGDQQQVNEGRNHDLLRLRGTVEEGEGPVGDRSDRAGP